jgi:hypothetical protein
VHLSEAEAHGAGGMQQPAYNSRQTYAYAEQLQMNVLVGGAGGGGHAGLGACMLHHGFIAPTHAGAWVHAAPHADAWGGAGPAVQLWRSMLHHGSVAPNHADAWVGAAPHAGAWGGFQSHSYKDWKWLSTFTGYTVSGTLSHLLQHPVLALASMLGECARLACQANGRD